MRKIHCPPSLWERKATKAAQDAGLDPVKVLAGQRDRAHTTVRWSVWRELCAKGYSYKSIGLASGYDHTTIMSAQRNGGRPYGSNPHSYLNFRTVAA